MGLRIKKNLLICFLVSLTIMITMKTSDVKAVEFLSLDHIAISTGGAGVASSSSSFGSYYNPALLSRHQTGFEWVTSIGTGIREINLADHIDNLSDIELDETIDRIEYKANNTDFTLITGNSIKNFLPPQEQENIKIIKKELKAIAKENGLQLMPNVSVGFQFGNFGIGLFSISELTAFAIIDQNKLDIIVKKTKQNGIDLPTPVYVEYDETDNSLNLSDINEYNNSSLQHALDSKYTYLQLKGISYYEIPISYGRTIATPVGDLSLGGSFKFMPGYTYEKQIKVDTESGEISDEFDDGDEHKDTTFGIDAGFLFSPKMFNRRLTAGMVFKNINSPKFETKTKDEYTLDPQIRAGMSYHLWRDTLMFSLDLDISENETFLTHYTSQYFGGGVYFKPNNWMSVRCGLQQNIKESDDGTLLTAGIAFGLKWFKVDLAGQYSTETTEFDGNEIPRSGRVQLSLVSNLFYGQSGAPSESQYQDIDQRDIAKESAVIDEPTSQESQKEISDEEQISETVDMDSELKEELDSAKPEEKQEIPDETKPEETDKSLEESEKVKDEATQMVPSGIIAITPSVEPPKETVKVEPEVVSEQSEITKTKQKIETPKAKEKTDSCPLRDAGAKMRETINVSTALKKWAKSWSQMKADDYLSMYAPGFKTPKGMSRSKWEKQRRKRLKKDFIKVDISDLSVEFTACTKAEVRFEQAYASPKYKDNIRKLIIFEKVDSKWLIIKELSLE